MSVRILVLICCALMACGDDRQQGPMISADQGRLADMDVDMSSARCQERCQRLESCGVLNGALTCQERCAQQPDGGFEHSCGQCILERGCAQAASCLERSACASPEIELTLAISGVSADRVAQAMLLDWRGERVGPLATAKVSSAQVALLAMGDVLYSALAYKVRYFVDVNEDGVCQPELDESGVVEINANASSVVVLQYSAWSDQVEPSCEGFLTPTQLCAQRCDRSAQCESSIDVVSCEQRCAQAPIEEALRCVSCQAQRGCLQIGAECDSAGGPCAPGYVPPDATLLVGLSAQLQEIGYPVKARVLHSAGQVIEEAKPVRISDEGFAMLDFGLNLWRGQRYRVELFIDRDGAGGCEDSSDAVYFIDVEIPETSALIYKITPPEQLIMTTCMMTSYGS